MSKLKFNLGVNDDLLRDIDAALDNLWKTEKKTTKKNTDICPNCQIKGMFIKMALCCPKCKRVLGGV